MEHGMHLLGLLRGPARESDRKQGYDRENAQKHETNNHSHLAAPFPIN